MISLRAQGSPLWGKYYLMHPAVEKMKLKLSLEWAVRHLWHKDGDSVEGTSDCGDFITWQRT